MLYLITVKITHPRPPIREKEDNTGNTLIALIVGLSKFSVIRFVLKASLGSPE